MTQANTFILTLKEAYLITKRVKHFVFACPTYHELNYRPGQFITIYFQHQQQTMHRSYSIANAPSPDQLIELAAGWVEKGPGTEYLFQLKPGDSLEAKGPFGRLILKDNTPKRYVLIGTRPGVTPYRAMLPELSRQLHTNPSLEVVLLQGVQTQADLLYHAEFIAFAEANPRVTYRAQLSREQLPEPNAPYLYTGHVQTAFPTLRLQTEQDVIYLCGNPNMVDESFTWLKEAGFPLQQIVREKYISR